MEDIIRLTDNYYIVATASTTDEVRVLKQGDSFGVFVRSGDIEPTGLGEQGIYPRERDFFRCSRSGFFIELDDQKRQSSVHGKSDQPGRLCRRHGCFAARRSAHFSHQIHLAGDLF
jgi:hypothetical protein